MRYFGPRRCFVASVTKARRSGLLLGLALVGCGLLVYDIGLRSNGPSVTITAVDQLSTALKHVPEIFQRAGHAYNCLWPTKTPTFEQFFNFVEENTPCESMKMFGGRGNNPKADGSKAVCMDPNFAPREKGCVVLSFGINNEWSFDDAMEKQGCRVYAFDPTIGMGDHTRGQNILFFSLGLSDKEKTITIKNKQVPVTNLRGILDRFELLGTDIDYLKIDIEGSELDFFKNVLLEDRKLLTRVKQIGMEIHTGKLNIARRDLYWQHIHHLHCLGFRQVSSEANTAGNNPFLFGSRNVSSCYELVWINETYL